MGRRFTIRLTTALALLAAVLALPAAALADPPLGALQNFGPNLKDTCPNPEGLAADPTGNLYAATAGGRICVINARGQLTDNFAVSSGPGGVTVLLGELFEPSQGLYVVDAADALTSSNPRSGRLLRIDPASHAVTTLAPPGSSSLSMAAPNGIAQDRHGNLYVSDSFQGIIFKAAPDGSSFSIWAQGTALQTKGTPPFGANGLAFDRNQRFLYVANTGDSTILRIPVQSDGSAGTLETFASGSAIDAQQSTTEALHGADGIAFDVQGNLYVCANQANEVQVLSPDARLGPRYRAGGDNALDFPASLVFKGKQLFVSNLSFTDNGVNSKLSLLSAPYAGLPLRP